MRLFIAIQIPAKIQEYLLELQKLFKPHGTYTFTKETHLTLKFLGDIRPAQLDRIITALQHIPFKPFVISLNTLGIFPNTTTPRVLWAGITPKEPVITLQQQIDKTLKQYFQPDMHYHPHLTIARIKKITNKTTFAKLLTTQLTPLKFTVDKYKLIESTLNSEGPTYTIKASFGEYQKNSETDT